MDNVTKRDHLVLWRRCDMVHTHIRSSLKKTTKTRHNCKCKGKEQSKREKNKKSKANDIENVNVNIQQVIYVDDSKTASIMLNDIFKQYLRLNKFKQSHYCILLPQRQHYFLLH